MKMVDISLKPVTHRMAIAEAIIRVKPSVVRLIKDRGIPKGEVLEAARIAGILAAKMTPQIIPLCHPIPITGMSMDFILKGRQIYIRAAVKGEAKTGFEMEALTAVTAAALTIYDMCKPLDKDMIISEIKLLEKTGGKSARYVRK